MKTQDKTYDYNGSHTHCWNQGKSPACGQKIENHKQCCLCDTPMQKYTQLAIKRAIEGGWDINGLKGQMNYTYSWKTFPFTNTQKLWCTDDIGGQFWLDENMMYMFPSFWRALGKSEGWPKETLEYSFATQCWDESQRKIVDGSISRNIPTYRANWIKFIEALDADKDPESFFESLLKK